MASGLPKSPAAAFLASQAEAGILQRSERMAGKVLTVVKRRPGGNAHVLQKFLKLEAHEDISVLDAFEAVVVPALEQKNLLRGRDWGSLLQAEVMLKHEASLGLIEVDQVSPPSPSPCSLHRQTLDLPEPSRAPLTGHSSPSQPHSPRRPARLVCVAV